MGHFLKSRFCFFLIAMASAAGVACSALPVSAQNQDPPIDEAPIRVETLLINVPVIVSDRDGRFIGGLKKSDFALKLDGVEQEIEYFGDSEAPISVAIVVDLSGSVIPVLSQIRDAAKAFINKLNPDDKAMLVTFDQKRRIDVVTPLIADKRKLADGVSSLAYDRRGSYAEAHRLSVFPDMYDAIAQIVKKEFKSVTTRKAIIVLNRPSIRDVGSLIEEIALTILWS